MKVNGRTNNALFILLLFFYFLTLDTNDTHSKLKEPKKHNRQILETNIIFSLFFLFFLFFLSTSIFYHNFNKKLNKLLLKEHKK